MATNGDQRQSNGQFAPGHSGGPGRPLGSPDRTPYLREQLEAAVAAAGGQAWINELVRDNPVEALKLLARLQPKEAPKQHATARPVRIVICEEKPPNATPETADRAAHDS